MLEYFKFFFTKPSIPLQSVRIRKGFGAKNIKNFLITLITAKKKIPL